MLNLGLWHFTKVSEGEGFGLIVEGPMLGPTKFSLTLIVGLPWPIIFLLYEVTINKGWFPAHVWGGKSSALLL